MSFCLHKTVLSFIYSRFVVKVLLLPEELVGTVCRKYIFQLWLFHVIVLNKHVVDCTKYYINVMIITLMIEMEVLVLFCLLFFSLFFFLFRNNMVLYSAAIRTGFVWHGDFPVLNISTTCYSSFKILNYKASIHTSGKESSRSTVVLLRLILIINVPRGQFSIGY